MDGNKLLRLTQVINLIGLSKSSIYALIRQGQFPAPFKISKQSSAWFEHEILDWCLSKSVTRRNFANTSIMGGQNV